MPYAATTILAFHNRGKGEDDLLHGTGHGEPHCGNETGGAEGVMVVPPGSSGFVRGDGAKSPHYEDQLEMFNKFQYKPLLIKEDMVKAKAKSKLNLQYTYE